ncbi:myb/SANT-like DNA-binding domain-containing protein 3 [Prorops nasuta]|uniref:myb/SANT-like DNA-binding domain-containing protein 3 n=1 Tax=Prorops nasuta TaxID=863751 RepID=UPI0034CDAAB2
MTSKSNLPRCSNYTIDEKLCLIRIVNKYSNKIENKQTDKVGLKEKNDTWKKVEKKWNEIAEYENKTANNLKFLWNNLKKIARKNFAKLKSETYKTGGGSCNVKLDIISEKVHEIIGRSITGIRYQHDSDNQTMEVLLQDHENDDPNIDCDDPVFEVNDVTILLL